MDGYQIRTLVLTMLYRLTPTLINKGYVYIAESPLYEINTKNKTYFAYTEPEKADILRRIDGEKYTIQRSKGLGENDPEMMWLTTMSPDSRRLIKVLPTDRPDAWEVQGRGELALAVLAEQMRREGYELTVGRPQVVTKKIDGVINEPMENTTIDVPEEYMGTVTQLMADRKGRMDGMTNHGSGWVRLQFTVPSRGLIGFRTALLSATRGTGISSSISAGYAPWAGAITIRQNGSMVSDRKGIATPYAMQRLQARGNFFVEPQSPVYEGQVVGVNNKPDELDVNITLAKHMTNMRSSTADVLETLTPPIKMSLEESLDFANEDECVEVTPESIRVRKIILGREDWYKWRAKQRRQNAAQQGK